VGIADQWAGHAEDPHHWRDMHFQIEGPVVAQFQAAFLDNWIKTTGRVLSGDTYFPALPLSWKGAAPLAPLPLSSLNQKFESYGASTSPVSGSRRSKHHSYLWH
jgi:phosphatidylserine/phosphatidylglycerophosphate/cardiolipin synthase-like enzyme